MIENRFRMEREIFRGRQAVRRNKDRSIPLPTTSNSIPVPQQQQPFSVVTNTSYKSSSVPAISVSDDGGGASDAALLADTETEAGEIESQIQARKERVSGSQAGSGQSTPKDLKASEDPLRSQNRRKKWANELLDDENVSAGSSIRENRIRTPDPPPEEDFSAVPVPETLATPRSSHIQLQQSQATPRVEPPGLLARLRSSASLHRLSSTFSWNRMGSSSSTNINQDAWSSESSSDDELEDLPYTQSGFSRPQSFYGSSHDLLHQYSVYPSSADVDET